MLIKPGLSRWVWPTIIDVKLRKSVCKRFAPLTPEGMHVLLMEKKFTNGTKDRDHVVKLYTKVAERCIYPAKKLDYHNMGFGDEEMKVLCEWWVRCEELQELQLSSNAFTAMGWNLLAVTLGRERVLPKLKGIKAEGNKSKPSDCENLERACEKRGITLIDN